MTRPLAYIQKISSLEPIPGADAIEKATVLGWELVVKKNEFNVGDLCIYCEIDSILPEKPEFEFLRPKKFIIKTIKLRGQISQGICFPLSILPPNVKPKLELDVTDILGITKYDPEDTEIIIAEPKSWVKRKFDKYLYKLLKGLGIKYVKPKGSFPNYVPKTDEIRVQNYNLSHHAGKPAYITEKMEGTSCTVVYRHHNGFWNKLLAREHELLVCSRNQVVYTSIGKRKDINSKYYTATEGSHFIFDKLKQMGRNLAIQGEVIGPSVQGNIYKLDSLQFKVFLIYDIDAKKYLGFDEMVDITDELLLDMVPVVDEAHTIIDNRAEYVKLSAGNSAVYPKVLREGIVIRGVDDDFSFKSINPEYLLKSQL